MALCASDFCGYEGMSLHSGVAQVLTNVIVDLSKVFGAGLPQIVLQNYASKL